jgi:tetratricopeptide (TPR) repeat protein
MYLRGNKWTMTKRPRKRPSYWRVILLLALIGIALYINQVVVPATPPLFIPTATPTTSPEAFINQAEELFKAGKLTQAIEAYQQAISTDPTNPATYVALARIQVLDGQYDDAILNAQNALLKNPNNPLAHAVQGWALGFKGNYGEAELEIQKALSLDANSALTHAYYAEILINQGDFNLFDKAAEESRIARDLDNTLMEVHRARGIVLLNTQNVTQAIDEFKTALSINKNISDLHLYLGLAYKANQQLDLAEEELVTAVTFNPTDTIALTELARSYFADGRYRQAAQYAEEAVKIDPTNPRLHGDLGIMHYKNEEYTDAIPELELAVRGGKTADGAVVEGLPLDYDPRVMGYYWYYGFALAYSNRCPEAVPVFHELLTEVPDDETAVYNANFGLDLCQQTVNTSSKENNAQPTATPSIGK